MFAMKEIKKPTKDLVSSSKKGHGNSDVPMANPSQFLQRHLGNSYLQSMADAYTQNVYSAKEIILSRSTAASSNDASVAQRKSLRHVSPFYENASNTGLVLQFQTDPTRPIEMVEEPSSEEGEAFVEAGGASEDIEDAGEGVSSIERVSPFEGSGCACGNHTMAGSECVRSAARRSDSVCKPN